MTSIGKSRGLTLSAQEVRDLLDGETVILRPMTPQPSMHVIHSAGGDYESILWPGPHPPVTQTSNMDEWERGCQPCVGTVIYGREPWVSWEERCYDRRGFERPDEEHRCDEHCHQVYVAYKATPRKGYRPKPDKASITYLHESTPLSSNRHLVGPWRQAMLMPQWASRIHRVVTKVRVVDIDGLKAFNASKAKPAKLPNDLLRLPRWVWVIYVEPLPVVDAVSAAMARNVAIRKHLNRAAKELKASLDLGMGLTDDTNIGAALKLVLDTCKGIVTV